MFRRCILHIGTEKTGTTSIQTMLTQNADALERQGIHVPRVLGRGNHKDLVTHAMDDDVFDDGRKKLGLQTNADVFDHRRDVEKRLSALCSTAHTLLVSSEHMHSRLTTVSSIQRLRELLSPYCEEFLIICYIRPQHELAISLYSTALRLGFFQREILPSGVKQKSYYYDYEEILSRWASVFGEEALVPRIYSRESLKAGDARDDFLEIIGVDVSSLVKSTDRNASLSGEAQAFLEAINPFLKQPRGDLFRLLEQLGSARGACPSRAEIQSFYSLFSDSNERVREKWFPERESLFVVDFSRYPEKPYTPTLSMEEAFRLFAEVWKKKHEQTLELRARLTRNSGHSKA